MSSNTNSQATPTWAGPKRKRSAMEDGSAEADQEHLGRGKRKIRLTYKAREALMANPSNGSITAPSTSALSNSMGRNPTTTRAPPREKLQTEAQTVQVSRRDEQSTLETGEELGRGKRQVFPTRKAREAQSTPGSRRPWRSQNNGIAVNQSATPTTTTTATTTTAPTNTNRTSSGSGSGSHSTSTSASNAEVEVSEPLTPPTTPSSTTHPVEHLVWHLQTMPITPTEPRKRQVFLWSRKIWIQWLTDPAKSAYEKNYLVRSWWDFSADDPFEVEWIMVRDVVGWIRATEIRKKEKEEEEEVQVLPSPGQEEPEGTDE